MSGWPGWCQKCGAAMLPGSGTWCRACGTTDADDCECPLSAMPCAHYAAIDGEATT